MKIKNTAYKTSLAALLAGISLSSLADPTCAELMATGGGANVTAAIASEYSSTLLSTVNGCLTSYCASQSNPEQCQANLTIASYAVTYAGVLQGYSPHTFTPTPNPSSSSALPPQQAPASLPEPTAPQNNNTSTATGYVPTPQLSNNNANNPSNTNSNNNNISNNTRSYIRWY